MPIRSRPDARILDNCDKGLGSDVHEGHIVRRLMFVLVRQQVDPTKHQNINALGRDADAAA